MTRQALRGARVEVRGRVRVDGKSPGGLVVQVRLAGPGGVDVPVGGATTAPDGSFALPFELPRTMSLGRHRVLAFTDGDAERAPAHSPFGRRPPRASPARGAP